MSIVRIDLSFLRYKVSGRTGTPLTARRHDRGLSTEIGHNRDANGRTLSGQKRRQLSRLRRQHARAQWDSTAERNLGHGLGEVRRIAGALDLATSLVEQACALFRRAQNTDLLRGRSIEAIAAASVYATCRCNELPRSLGDIAELARIDGNRVDHAYTILNRELSLPTVPLPPAAYVPPFASTLECSDEVRRRGEAIAEQAHEQGLSNGKNPAGVAAGALYLAVQEYDTDVTQETLAEAADISPVTVRNRWNELRVVADSIDC